MPSPEINPITQRTRGPSVQIARSVYGLSDLTEPYFINEALDAGITDISHVTMELSPQSQVVLVAAGEVSRVQKLSGEPNSQEVMEGLVEHLEGKLIGSFNDLHFLQAKPVDEKRTIRHKKIDDQEVDVEKCTFITPVDPALKWETKLARIATCEYFGLDFEDILYYDNVFSKPGTSRLLIATAKFKSDINIVRQLIADTSLVQEQYILAPVDSKVVKVTID